MVSALHDNYLVLLLQEMSDVDREVGLKLCLCFLLLCIARQVGELILRIDLFHLQ